MKKFTIIIFSVLFVWLLSNEIRRITNERNDIDDLMEVAHNFEQVKVDHKHFYFYTNQAFGRNKKLSFQTQFAFAPLIVIRSKFENIPKDSLILYIESKKIKQNMPQPIRRLKDTVHFAEVNEQFRYFIFRKK